MADPMLQRLLDKLDARERELTEQAEHLPALLRELEAERETLRITAKTVRAMADELAQPAPPTLPDGAAYQQIIAIFDQQDRPLRARDLCQALDLPPLPKHTEGTRAKLKRLVSLGFLNETEPGLFTQRRPQADNTPDDQQP